MFVQQSLHRYGMVVGASLSADASSAASNVLRAVLDPVTHTDAQVEQYSRERLQDRRIQIINLDRARPEAGDSSAHATGQAQRKLNSRKRRVKSDLSRMKRMHMASSRQTTRNQLQPSSATETLPDKQRHAATLKRELKRMQNQPKTANSAKTTDRRSQKQLSRRKRKHLGLEDIDDDVNIELLKPLHRLWCSYIQQLLNMVVLNNNGDLAPNTHFDSTNLNVMSAGNVTAVQASLIKADLCGAELEVVRSSNPSLVSQRGLLIKETERTIVLAIAHTSGRVPRAAAKGKNVRVIPKHNTVFNVCVPLPDSSPNSDEKLHFELHGSHMMHTLPSRATRKYKARPTIDF